MEVRNNLDTYLKENVENKSTGTYQGLKRFFDIIFSVVLFIFTLPIILLFLLLIILESPGNPIFLQKRMGLCGKEFDIIKLRSMHLNAEKNGAQWACKNDSRITKIGKFIRKTRIDELPQLLNVIKGEMSLIGPRPERRIFVEEFSRELPDFPKRLEVRPGLTGLAQVNGGYDINPKQKLEFDLIYIENLNMKLDINIFFKTIKVVISGNGSR